ncbi:hypothetical protein [Leptospira sp. GIMC2001]|uniref:hypothetical protein n=1 Tax=Leptospira sp. GIMC2001 TaxID=1513297 RepID=UPI0023498F60|nr:hypothetical protein [Leptospira sp. GIMC2001]WCL48226.1 hypothetical protein O4O04_13025 [Leptospira sp. GIMC2001]
MKLSSEIISPLEILSESEIYFLKYIIPVILLFPWIIFAIYKFLIWIAKFFSKDRANSDFELNNSWLNDTIVPRERPPILSDLERLALENPRRALNELSRYCRIVHLGDEFHNPSLEFWIRKVDLSLNPRWIDITSVKHKGSFRTEFSVVYSDILLSSYQKLEPKPESVISLIQKVRTDLRGKIYGI